MSNVRSYYLRFNGWPTAARFQSQRPCLICSSCEGSDSIEHYAVCRFQWIAFHKKLTRPLLPQSLARFLGLEGGSLDDMVFMACHIYAVRSTTNYCRSTGITYGPDAVQNVLWQYHRTATCQHFGLRRRYRRIWEELR